MKTFSTAFICLMCCWSTASLGQAEEPVEAVSIFSEESGRFKGYFKNYDSIPVQKRAFSTAELETLQQDSELQYGYVRTAVSFWDMFTAWVSRMLKSLFRPNVQEGNWYDFFWFALFTVVIVYVIMRLLKVNHLKIFFGAPKTKKNNFLVIEDNIHEMDFEALLKKAAANREYREAVRLTYLFALKLLADKHHIQWEPGKTNEDYLNELHAAPLKNDFRQLNYFFEYAWYGNFPVTHDLYTRAEQLFTNWKNKV